MKYIITLYFFAGLIACKGTQEDIGNSNPQSLDYQLRKIVDPSVTTFICVRHTEKQSESDDPELTQLGVNRANDLSNLLANIPIDAIYSSDYRRTKMTAMPTSRRKKIKISLYDPSELESFADELWSKHKEKTVLVVGHSNTTPQLTNYLCKNSTYGDISHDEYDQIYVVAESRSGELSHHVIEYGLPSPQLNYK